MQEKLVFANLREFEEGCAKEELFDEMVSDSKDFGKVPNFISDLVSKRLRGTDLVVENPYVLNTGKGR